MTSSAKDRQPDRQTDIQLHTYKDYPNTFAPNFPHNSTPVKILTEQTLNSTRDNKTLSYSVLIVVELQLF